MDNDVREALNIIADTLELLHNNIQIVDKRVTMLENNENVIDEYITIRIPKNASNLDVLRKVFNCIVVEIHERAGVTYLDLDEHTCFNTRWLHTLYKGGCRNETDE